MRPLLLCLPLLLASPLLVPSDAGAQGMAQDLGAEAARQIQLAREDLQAGQYERAIQACESALRLDSTQFEALKIKGLALEQLGRKDEAMAMFLAYNTFRSGLEPDPEVEDALDRLDKKRARRRKKEQAAAAAAEAEAEQFATETPKAAPPALNPAPFVLIGAGAGLAAAGFAMHGVAFEEGVGFTDGTALTTKESYQGIYDRNVAGLALGIAGAATAGAGVGVLVALLAAPKDGSVAWTVAPTVTPRGVEGGTLLLLGRF